MLQSSPCQVLPSLQDGSVPSHPPAHAIQSPCMLASCWSRVLYAAGSPPRAEQDGLRAGVGYERVQPAFEVGIRQVGNAEAVPLVGVPHKRIQLLKVIAPNKIKVAHDGSGSGSVCITAGSHGRKGDGSSGGGAAGACGIRRACRLLDRRTQQVQHNGRVLAAVEAESNLWSPDAHVWACVAGGRERAYTWAWLKRGDGAEVWLWGYPAIC
mmetsp:Transcript_42391/g.127076  ORF Transcript_42391/g.127076 Transcript_42391/m.127076 type:complete len:211 (+) Transcript_42391:90-722(+)